METSSRAALPSVDRPLRSGGVESLIAQYGLTAVTSAVCDIFRDLRVALRNTGQRPDVSDIGIVSRVSVRLFEEAARFFASVPLRRGATEGGLLGFSALRWTHSGIDLESGAI